MATVIRDKEHAEVYTEMLISCEDDINKLTGQIQEFRDMDATVKKRKKELKKSIDLLDSIVADGAVSDTHLRMLIEQITIVFFALAEVIYHLLKLCSFVVDIKRAKFQSGSSVNDTNIQLCSKLHWSSYLSTHNGTNKRLAHADDTVGGRCGYGYRT